MESHGGLPTAVTVATVTKVRKSYLQHPSAGPRECVAAVNDVPVLGEAAQHVPHALLQGVDLGLNQNFDHQVVCGVLNQPLAYTHKKEREDRSSALFSVLLKKLC